MILLLLLLYYLQGTHPITRPYALQPTMESCAETITQKLQSYYHQANDYHNQCLQGNYYISVLCIVLTYFTFYILYNNE